MMLGAVPTSVPQFILLGNWLLEGKFKNKWQRLRSNPVFWSVISLFWMHVIGIAWSHSFGAACDDLRIKVPLFFLALVFFGSAPLSKKEFHGVLICFLAGAFCNTAWCLAYNFVLYHNQVGRDASRFMSHIRLGMYLNMAIASCVYLAAQTQKFRIKALLILLGFYFIFIMFVLGLASGLSMFFILCLLGLCVIIYSQKNWVKLISALLLAGLALLVANYILKVKSEQLDVRAVKNNTLLKVNEAGHEYIYLDTLTKQKENGNYVMINIQMNELKRVWQREFPADSFSYDPQHNLKRFDVLLRYLASKGLNKDSAALAQLSAEDKGNIQKDISNYKYPQWNYLHKRTYELVNEYDEFMHHRNVNGHSMSMRPYFWKAAWHVIGQHPLFGVGTGDVQQQLEAAYDQTQSPLRPEWHKRPHNQFLTVLVSLGVAGLLVLLFSIFYPVAYLRRDLPALFWPFLAISLVSFLTEDTLESQAGLTFYAVFSTLFLSVAWFRKNISV